MYRTVSGRSPASRQPCARRHRLVYRFVGSTIISTAIMLVGWLPATPVHALESDRNQPIRIESDRAERDEKAGTTIYIGDVNLRQGTLLIRSDRLEIYTKNNEVTDVIATGKPAYMEQQPKPDKPLVKARANTINYYVSKERLNLKGHASVEQEGSIVKSDVIDYFLDSELIKAHGGVTNPDQRVHVVIPPSRVNEEEKKATDKASPPANAGQPAAAGAAKTPAAGSAASPVPGSTASPPAASKQATPTPQAGKEPAPAEDATTPAAPAASPSGGG